MDEIVPSPPGNRLRFLQNLLALSVATLIITVWATVTFLAYQNKSLKEGVSSRSQNSIYPTTITEPTNKWKTVTFVSDNSALYEIKYPPTWSFTDFPPSYNLLYLNDNPGNETNPEQLRILCPMGQEFTEIPVYNFDDPIANLKYTKNITSNSKEEVLYIFGISDDPRGRKFSEMCTYILRKTNPRYCSICKTITDRDTYNEDFVLSQTTYNQILSTFKFLPDNPDWKTYKNDEYNFEFDYPSSCGIKVEDKLLNNDKYKSISLVVVTSDSFCNFDILAAKNISMADWLIGLEPKSASGASLVTKTYDTNLLNTESKEWEVMGFDHTDKMILFSKYNNVYAISYDYIDPNIPNFDTLIKITNRILSSFRFTE